MERKPVAPERYTDQLAALAGFIGRACAFTGHRPQKLPWRFDETAPGCVLALRVTNPSLRLHCILPCAAQSAKWSAALQKQYRAILEQADSIIFVNRANKKDCMLERDRFLVSYASLVLAVYNGERRGGTAATVRYARKLGRELIVIDPATLTVTREWKTEP